MNKFYSEESISNIANAIRTKNGSTDTYKVSQMAEAILSIPSEGGITPSGTISITANGKYDVTNYAQADVSVSTSGDLPNNIFTGTFSVDEDSNAGIQIQHNIGSTPIQVFIYPDNSEEAINTFANTVVGGMSDNIYCMVTNSVKAKSVKSSIFNIIVDNSNITIEIVNSNYYMRSSLVYRWIAWV